MEIFADGVESAFYQILENFHEGTDIIEVSPRGQRSKDLISCAVHISNPRDRLIFNPVRNINPAAIIGETLWYLRGSNSLSEIVEYVPYFYQCSDDGKTVHSAYGHRIKNGIHTVIEQLRKDPDSKRATLPILHTKDVDRMIETKDFPCTVGLNFMIRRGRLDVHTFMRAQDVFWGLQHDMFYFTFLQEIVALELRVPLGVYHQYVSAFNLYERHYDKVQSILKTKTKSTPMNPLECGNEISKLQEQEQFVRTEKECTHEFSDPSLHDCMQILLLNKKLPCKPLKTDCFRRLMREE